MKLSPLPAQFLYTNKELILSGIGRFRIEETGLPPAEEAKNPKGQPDVKIFFEQNTAVKENENLISFIASQTGKMKSLAAADLDSHMELARQFLNIGKPFLLEGIGTLVKNKFGRFEFTQGVMPAEKIKDITTGESQTSFSTEESFTDYEEMFSPKKPSRNTGKKLLFWFSMLAGIGLAVWGGYTMYTRSATQSNQAPADSGQMTVPVDTPLVKKDTLVTAAPPPDTTRYRYVIEEAARERAFKRFNDLNSYGLRILMETKDSLLFKLYFEIPSLPADTARIRDSLTLLYGSMGRTKVERPG